MSHAFAIFLMMNNYLHDVATALLAASALVLWVLLRRFEASPRGPEATRLFVDVQRAMVRLARLSLAWIVIGGIPRTIWYADFEWANAAGRGQIAALAVKHAVALVLVVYGVFFWRRLRSRIRAAEASLAG